MPSTLFQTLAALEARIEALPAWDGADVETDSGVRKRKSGNQVRTQVLRGSILAVDQSLGDTPDGGTYWHAAKCEIEIEVSGDPDTRNQRLDALLVALGTAQRTDATYGGVCTNSELQGAQFDNTGETGTGAPVSVANVSMLIEYESENPLI